MDAMTPIAETKLQLLPLGIHFGLLADRYHEDPGLGSGDVRLLRRNPTTYWQRSRHLNPDWKERKSRFLERGRAMHVLVFDGEAAFDAAYVRGAEHDEDMTPAEKGALTKAVNAKAAARGMTALLAVDYDRVVIAHEIIKRNPETRTVFTGGFAEVSVFWERRGVRRKARIDYLKVMGIGDLKGTSNQYDADFEEVCRMAVMRYRYDMQAAHYLEARSMIARMVADGAVYGDHDKTLLKKIAANEGVGWQWVFYCYESGAPDAFSYKLVHGNPMIDVAQRDVEIATARYTRFMKEFGTERWMLIKPPQHLTMEMMPPWFARCSPEEMAEYEDWMKGERS